MTLMNCQMESKDEGGLLVKVDHMLDGFSKKSVRLGNPIAIKIEQGPVFTIYPIKFLKERFSFLCFGCKSIYSEC